MRYQRPSLYFVNNHLQNVSAYCADGSGATRDPGHGFNCTQGPQPGDPYCANGNADTEALYTCKNGVGVISVSSCGAGNSPQEP